MESAVVSTGGIPIASAQLGARMIDPPLILGGFDRLSWELVVIANHDILDLLLLTISARFYSR